MDAVGETLLPDGILATEAAMTLADFPADLRIERTLETLGWRVDF